jgi:hypothetical protein
VALNPIHRTYFHREDPEYFYELALPCIRAFRTENEMTWESEEGAGAVTFTKAWPTIYLPQKNRSTYNKLSGEIALESLAKIPFIRDREAEDDDDDERLDRNAFFVSSAEEIKCWNWPSINFLPHEQSHHQLIVFSCFNPPF